MHKNGTERVGLKNKTDVEVPKTCILSFDQQGAKNLVAKRYLRGPDVYFVCFGPVYSKNVHKPTDVAISLIDTALRRKRTCMIFIVNMAV